MNQTTPVSRALPPRGLRALLRKWATRSESNLYFALLLLPRSKREALRAIYRYLRSADDLIDEAASPKEAEIVLAALHRELLAIETGTPRGSQAAELAKQVAYYALSTDDLAAIVRGFDLEGRAPRPVLFATRRQLFQYCDAVSGSLGRLCLTVFLGAEMARSPAAQELSSSLGVAVQIANVLRDIGADAARGAVYLPQEDLLRYGLTSAHVLRGIASKGLVQLVDDLANEALWRVEVAHQKIHELRAVCIKSGRELLVCEVWAAIYEAELLQAKRRAANANFQLSIRRSEVRLRRRRKWAIAGWLIAKYAATGAT